MTHFWPDKVLVVGLGLIGGSFAGAMKAAGCSQVLGLDKNPDAVARAMQLGRVDLAAEGLTQLPTVHTDLIFISVPPRQMASVFKNLKKLIGSGIVTIDACSVKSEVIDQAKKVFKYLPATFVPCHPVAGSHHSGIGSSDPDLFQGSRTAITPLPETRPESIEKIRRLWKLLGSEVVVLTPEAHDRALALSSHLPHLTAFALMSVFADQPDDLALKLSRRGLADSSRIAMGDPALWRDICLENRHALLETLEHYQKKLSIFYRFLKNNQGKKLRNQFQHARQVRLKLEEKAVFQYFRVTAGNPLRGTLQPPGDKSISHRALILAALAHGETVIRGFLSGDDCLATMEALRSLGVAIQWLEWDNKVRVHGIGGNFDQPLQSLDLGNSGTGVRLLAGLLAGSDFPVVLDGDSSLRERPMQRIITPLHKMGVQFEPPDTRKLPLTIRGSSELQGIEYHLPVASAQVKSCILLAGLRAKGTTTVIEPSPCRDHTERMLRHFGYPVYCQDGRVSLTGQIPFKGTEISVPGDFSSAMFAITAACICPGSQLTITGVGVNPTRIGGLTILKMMGADIVETNRRIQCGEPVADLRVTADNQLRGITVPKHLVASAIDEFPALFIAAACASGTTVLNGAEELRVKESDRLEVMARGLTVLGVKNSLYPDGIIINGGIDGKQGSDRLLTLDAAGDHRVAMSFAIAALCTRQTLVVRNVHNVATSWPGFAATMRKLGLNIQ